MCKRILSSKTLLDIYLIRPLSLLLGFENITKPKMHKGTEMLELVERFSKLNPEKQNRNEKPQANNKPYVVVRIETFVSYHRC